MSEEGAVVRSLFEAVIGLFRLTAFLIRFIVWGARKAHAFYRTRNPPSFTLPPAARFEHTHIVAGSGHGKTQLMQTLLLEDLSALSQGPARLSSSTVRET